MATNDRDDGAGEPRLSRRSLLVSAAIGTGVASAVAVAGAVVGVIIGGHAPPPRLGIPGYVYPGSARFWEDVLRLPAGTPVIVNPASGPGERVDPKYTALVDAMRARKLTVLGYVDTSFGARDHTLVVRDARAFHEMYGIDDVFLDQTPGSGDQLAAFAATITDLRATARTIAMNPGQPLIDHRYCELADHVMNFEGTLDTYQATTFPSWVTSYPRDRFWHLVYGVEDAARMQQTVRLVSRRHAGLVYVTDAGMPNPWDRLPSYWDAELKALSITPAP